MCDSQTQIFIEDVVDGKVDEGIMFTAFEISLDVKKKQKISEIPILKHSEMKVVIHNTMSPFLTSGIYLKQMVDVGAAFKAILYYPHGSDPDDYVPLTRDDSPIDSPVAKPVAKPQSNPVYKPLNKNILTFKELDKWGRLRINAAFSKAAGFKPGDIVYILKLNSELQIVNVWDHQQLQPIASYVIDRYSNIRITGKTLRAEGCFGPAATKFELESSPGKIMIR